MAPVNLISPPGETQRTCYLASTEPLKMILGGKRPVVITLSDHNKYILAHELCHGYIGNSLIYLPYNLFFLLLLTNKILPSHFFHPHNSFSAISSTQLVPFSGSFPHFLSFSLIRITFSPLRSLFFTNCSNIMPVSHNSFPPAASSSQHLHFVPANQPKQETLFNQR